MRGVERVLGAYEPYWRKSPSVKRLVLKAVPDETTRLAMLKRGEADIVFLLQSALAEEAQRTPGLTLRPTPIVSTHWLVFLAQWDPKPPRAGRRGFPPPPHPLPPPATTPPHHPPFP